MALIAIAFKHTTPDLQFFFSRTGCDATITEENIGNWPHAFCRVNESRQDGHSAVALRRMLAESLADYLVREQVRPYLNDMISHYYFYFPRDEQGQILEIAEKHYREELAKNEGGRLAAEVQNCLQEYLAANDYVNLHGLVVFRLRAWLEFLRKVIDRSVDDFLMEKEYQEFIKLLKYFVALQEPKVNQIHVTLDEAGKIRLLDQSYQPVSRQQGIQWESYEGTADEEDQLVSMLITAAPHRVVLHKHVYAQYPKAADTLKNVFENRVTLCKRCKLCHDVSRHFHF